MHFKPRIVASLLWELYFSNVFRSEALISVWKQSAIDCWLWGTKWPMSPVCYHQRPLATLHRNLLKPEAWAVQGWGLMCEHASQEQVWPGLEFPRRVRHSPFQVLSARFLAGGHFVATDCLILERYRNWDYVKNVCGTFGFWTLLLVNLGCLSRF